MFALGLTAATASRRKGTAATGSPVVRTVTTGTESIPANIAARSIWCRDMYASACELGDRQPAVAHISHHPNHLPRFGAGVGQQQALADGRFAAEQCPCERLVDHQHRRTLRPVEPSERATAPDAQAHRVEVAGADDVDGSLREVSRLGRRRGAGYA